MSKETSFNNPGDVEPAKIKLNGMENVQDEQLDESTPAIVPNKQGEHEATPALDTTPVQALPQESEVYKNLQAAFTKTSQENSNLRGRLEQMEARLASLSTTQQPAVTAPQANLEALDKVAEEFEELKPIIAEQKRMQSELNSQKTAIDTQATNAVQTDKERNQNEHERLVMQAHPDARQIMGSIDFQGWLQRQPSYMQGLLNTGPSGGSSTEIIDLFTAYKTAVGNNQQPQQLTPEQQALEAARLAGAPVQKGPAPIINTTDSNKRIYTNDEIGKMNFKEYAALSDDIDLALAEGRVTL